MVFYNKKSRFRLKYKVLCNYFGFFFRNELHMFQKCLQIVGHNYSEPMRGFTCLRYFALQVNVHGIKCRTEKDWQRRRIYLDFMQYRNISREPVKNFCFRSISQNSDL